MKRSVMFGLVIVACVALAMTGCNSTSGMKGDMSTGQHPAGCTCTACSMK